MQRIEKVCQGAPVDVRKCYGVSRSARSAKKCKGVLGCRVIREYWNAPWSTREYKGVPRNAKKYKDVASSAAECLECQRVLGSAE